MKYKLFCLGISLISIYCVFSLKNLFQLPQPLINSSPVFSFRGDSMVVALNYPRRGEGQLYLIDLNGKILKRLTNNRMDNGSPAISADGNYIVYVERDPNREDSPTRLWRMDLRTGDRQKILDSGFADYGPSFSKSGNQVVFSRSVHRGQEHMGFGKIWRGWDIYCLDITNNRVTALTNKKYYSASLPRFINSDRSVIFMCEGNDAPLGIQRVSLENSESDVFVSKNMGFFKLSADEKRIIYLQGPLKREDGGGFSLNELDLTIGHERVLLKTKVSEYLNSFDISEDGGTIVFVTEKGNDRLYRHTNLFLLCVNSGKMREIKINTFAPWRQILRGI